MTPLSNNRCIQTEKRQLTSYNNNNNYNDTSSAIFFFINKLICYQLRQASVNRD